MTNKSLFSALTIATVGLGSKAFLNYLCANVEVVGLPRLLNELDRIRSGKGRGVLTVSNHISVFVTMALINDIPNDTLGQCAGPLAHLIYVSLIQRLFSELFRQGQVLETVRGNGIEQYAVDRSIELLNQGEWVHIFPEGKVSQPAQSKLRRLKWGIGRMLMETDEPPEIIPMWLTGFDQVMHGSRAFPRFLPRTGKRVSITFGNGAVLQDRIRALRESRRKHESAELRATITHAVQEELEKLGTEVSGPALVDENIREGK